MRKRVLGWARNATTDPESADVPGVALAGVRITTG
jgi:hypothetical protein